MAYEALQAAGCRTGLYTSPHLVDVRERMVVAGRPITEDAFAMWTWDLRPTIEETGASFFEATTAIALADFAARGVDIAVVEVGLGGRLDATNVLQPLACCVTTVSREHTEYLGESLEEIAREKAGIAKRGVPFVVGEQDPGSATELARAAAATGAPVVRVPPDACYEGPLALHGAHQRRNAAVAHALLACLPVSLRPDPAAVRRGFAVARLAGRLERRGKWIFDVAHNPSGIGVLAAALDAEPPPRPLHVLVGILGDKEWRRMLERLADLADAVWVTQPPSAPPDRRWDLSAVGRAMGDRARVEPDFDAALEEVQRGAAAVLVTGSFHTVGDAMARLPGFAPLG
jgi:dihydrofolate synthase/folylpolyglutamate synthase